IAWRMAQFDLTLLVAELDGALIGSLKYSTDLFEPTTIDRMIAHFEVLLGGIAAGPAQRIADLPGLAEAERRQLLAWNDTADGPRPDRCIHQLFEDQAARTPDALAVVFDRPTTNDQRPTTEDRGWRIEDGGSILYPPSSILYPQ